MQQQCSHTPTPIICTMHPSPFERTCTTRSLRANASLHVRVNTKCICCHGIYHNIPVNKD